MALVVAGCTPSFEPATQITPLEGGTVVSSTASLGHTLIHDPAANLVTCSLAQPDAAFDQADEGDISVSLISIGNDQSEKGADAESSEEVEMSGRTPTVLMARELFFRTCEFSQNHKLDKKEALELYKQTLEAVAKVWAIEAGSTTVTVGDTLSITEGTTVQSTSTQTMSDTETATDTTSETGSETKSDAASTTESDTSDSTTSN
jgi:hypothetical protein